MIFKQKKIKENLLSLKSLEKCSWMVKICKATQKMFANICLVYNFILFFYIVLCLKYKKTEIKFKVRFVATNEAWKKRCERRIKNHNDNDKHLLSNNSFFGMKFNREEEENK